MSALDAAGHYTAAIFSPITQELSEQVTLFNRQGAAYARAYLQHIRSGGQGFGPRAPLGMNAHIARAIREVVIDHAQHARFTAGRRLS